LQRTKDSGTYGLTRYYDLKRETALQDLNAGDGSDEILELNPDLKLPHYYTRIDIHQHPGGVWSDDVAGLVYEHGARSTTPLLGASMPTCTLALRSGWPRGAPLSRCSTWVVASARAPSLSTRGFPKQA